MAASGATPIILYHSTTGAAVPSNTNLSPGELAVNIADMKLYCENDSGVVTLLSSADAAAGNFTTVDINGGTIDGTVIGGDSCGCGVIHNPERMRLTSTGLGIGTSSPAQTLHVKTSTSATPITFGVLSNATGLPALSFNGAYASTTMAGIYGNGATASNLYYAVPAGQNHYFSIADVTKMTIDSSGNVGIGTSSPAVKLNVSGVGGISAEGSDSFTVNKVVEAGQASMYGDANNTHFSHNVYYDGDWKSASNANHGQLIFDSSGNFKIRYEGPSVGGTAITWDDLVTVTSAGAVEIANGNLVFSTNGTGIDFSASASGGATSSILDDYEEGTFTPAFSSSGAVFAYTSQQGAYTKIGRQVCFNIYLQLDGAQTLTANVVTITGLPFTSATISGLSVAMVCGIREVNLTAGASILVARIGSNSSSILLVEEGDNYATTNLNSNQLSGSSGQVMISGTYPAT
jgi:hypothetical protein